ncbi:hypothetical protein FNB15_13485 [Ferrovibrio terrae]|uniref:Uncharacterized protein n=1 Tax=Ferrovibrio terrae TaxID=2594003 RepID=A0A516H371_9PROT|nr:hypothetical protein [Ferrovibrio terrae]QDO98219.1 hypothetical protein FNB15_13485 [Ferrovibrio terrae]
MIDVVISSPTPGLAEAMKQGKPGYVRLRQEELSPERRAEIAERMAQAFAHQSDVLQKFADMDAQRAALAKGPENHVIVAPNVSGLSREQAEQQIYFMSELIQSGQSETMALSTGYGDMVTSNYRQYVYWLQQHVKELGGGGQSTLAQV